MRRLIDGSGPVPQGGTLTAPRAAPARAPRRRLVAMLAAGSVAGFAPPARAAALRLVCVGGALTEIVYALRAESLLVGVDSTSLHPDAATRLPGVGYARALSAEGLLSLSPTLIAVTEDAGPPAVLRRLREAGITVATLDASHRYEGVQARIARLGELLERRDAAAALATRLQQEWVAVQGRVSARRGPAPKVLFVLAHNPAQLMVSGRGTAADAMIGYAGGRNAVQGFEGYRPLTPEALVAAQPDLVLMTEQGLTALGGAAGAQRVAGLAQTPAGRRGRVVALEAMLLLGFGPRVPQAVAELHAALGRSLEG